MRGEEAGCGTAGARECGAGVGIGPGVTTVGGAENLVGPVARVRHPSRPCLRCTRRP